MTPFHSPFFSFENVAKARAIISVHATSLRLNPKSTDMQRNSIAAGPMMFFLSSMPFLRLMNMSIIISADMTQNMLCRSAASGVLASVFSRDSLPVFRAEFTWSIMAIMSSFGTGMRYIVLVRVLSAVYLTGVYMDVMIPLFFIMIGFSAFYIFAVLNMCLKKMFVVDVVSFLFSDRLLINAFHIYSPFVGVIVCL